MYFLFITGYFCIYSYYFLVFFLNFIVVGITYDSFCRCKHVDVQMNRPFSKMAAENSDKLKLAKTKNIYQH